MAGRGAEVPQGVPCRAVPAGLPSGTHGQGGSGLLMDNTSVKHRVFVPYVSSSRTSQAPRARAEPLQSSCSSEHLCAHSTHLFFPLPLFPQNELQEAKSFIYSRQGVSRVKLSFLSLVHPSSPEVRRDSHTRPPPPDTALGGLQGVQRDRRSHQPQDVPTGHYLHTAFPPAFPALHTSPRWEMRNIFK